MIKNILAGPSGTGPVLIEILSHEGVVSQNEGCLYWAVPLWHVAKNMQITTIAFPVIVRILVIFSISQDVLYKAMNFWQISNHEFISLAVLRSLALCHLTCGRHSVVIRSNDH